MGGSGPGGVPGLGVGVPGPRGVPGRRGGLVQGGAWSWGVWRRLLLRAVRILLECILVADKF